MLSKKEIDADLAKIFNNAVYVGMIGERSGKSKGSQQLAYYNSKKREYEKAAIVLMRKVAADLTNKKNLEAAEQSRQDMHTELVEVLEVAHHVLEQCVKIECEDEDTIFKTLDKINKTLKKAKGE